MQEAAGRQQGLDFHGGAVREGEGHELTACCQVTVGLALAELATNMPSWGVTYRGGGGQNHKREGQYAS